MSTPITPEQGHIGEPVEGPGWIALLLGGTVILTAIGIIWNYKGAWQDPKQFSHWVYLLGIIATLGIFSILYKENPIFRFLEHIFIGLATGFGIYYLWVNFLMTRWLVPMWPIGGSGALEGSGGHWWLIFALLLGLLFFTVYFPKLSWMNRFAIGVLMGWAAGTAFQMFMGLLMPQIEATLRPPVTAYAPPDNMPIDANNFVFLGLHWHPWTLLSLIVLLCVMAYFFFSVEHRARWIRTPANAGRYFLMITLGVIFGTTVMSRFTLLIGRFDYLMKAFTDWMHLVVK